MFPEAINLETLKALDYVFNVLYGTSEYYLAMMGKYEGKTQIMSIFLYSTNPFFTHHLVQKYNGDKHNVWCSDKYDPGGARSSSPCELFISLQKDCENEDTHSDLINRYKKTFRKLVASWVTDGKVTNDDKDEIMAEINSKSWIIWRPQLYIINREPIEKAGRLISVPVHERAALCEEWKIVDLDTSEFEIIERVK